MILQLKTLEIAKQASKGMFSTEMIDGILKGEVWNLDEAIAAVEQLTQSLTESNAGKRSSIQISLKIMVEACIGVLFGPLA
jgi:hypothetical protein